LKFVTGAAVAAALTALAVSIPAVADDVAPERIWASPRALISASTLDVRAEPTFGSAVIGTLPRGWPVAILDDDGPKLTIDGTDDHWSHVATFRCIDAACVHHETGWVANSYLALDDRFELLDDGRSGTLSGYDSRSVFTYDVSANGAFTRWRLPCTAGACDTLPSVTPNCDYDGELPLGSFCVLTGSLHRHGTLVRGKTPNGDWLDRQDVSLIINASGELCVQDPLMIDGACPCAASGHAAHAGHVPVDAIARLAAERRQRLALTAAVSLNLRAVPSLSGGIVARLALASTVERMGEQRIPVTLNGRSDRWVQVSVVDCADNTGCAPEAVGWVMDSYLAYEHRLTPVTDWPRAEQSGNQAFGLEVLSDGTFRRWEPCGTDGSGLKICSQSGQLYRYRELYVLRGHGGEVNSAYQAAAGNLCLITWGIRSDPAGRCGS